jgi:hypothetical protein
MPRNLNQSRITVAICASPAPSSGARIGFTDGVAMSSCIVSKTDDRSSGWRDGIIASGRGADRVRRAFRGESNANPVSCGIVRASNDVLPSLRAVE